MSVSAAPTGKEIHTSHRPIGRVIWKYFHILNSSAELMRLWNMFDIDRICRALEMEGAEAVAIYRDRLSANLRNEAVYQDFVYEGIVAFTFLRAGFHVTMRESPDLAVMWGRSMLYAEVKHFRWKGQDEIDAHLLGEAVNAGCLVSYGDTVPSEESAPWEQVLAVAKRKTPQYRDGFPNVLVIASSSTYAIDNAIMPTVVAMINEACRTPTGAGLHARLSPELVGFLVMPVERFQGGLQFHRQAEWVEVLRFAPALFGHAAADVLPKVAELRHVAAGDVIGHRHAWQFDDASLDGVHE
jgi:hypothetical protein